VIEHRVIDGRKADIVYMKEDFTPCDPEKAELIKVLFEDGEALFLTPKEKQ